MTCSLWVRCFTAWGTRMIAAGSAAFPDTNPRVRWQRALAQTIAPTRVNTGPDNYGWNYAGLPASTTLHWFPQFSTGTYTGMYQGPWSLAGNATYVTFGGEFLKVNGVEQQGLVRMAVSASALNKLGPIYTTQPARPVPETIATSDRRGRVDVSFGTAWDYDNQALTYEVLRNGVGAPVYTSQIASNFWTLPRVSFRDFGLPAGTTLFYQVRIKDPFGNTLWSPRSNSVTVDPRHRLTLSTADSSGPETQISSAVTSNPLQPGHVGRTFVASFARPTYSPILRNGKVPKALLPGSLAPLCTAAIVRYSDGVSVRVVEVSQGSQRGRGPGIFPGRPFTAFTLEITNHSIRPIDLNSRRGHCPVWFTFICSPTGL